MRYWIPHVHESINVDGAYCATAIVVDTPFSGTPIDIQVEIFDDLGNTLKMIDPAASVANGVRYTFVTDTEISPFWTVVDNDADLTNFTGFATVHSNDPRFYVSAFEWCRSGTGATDPLVAIHDLQVYAIGPTLEFLKAGLPMGPGAQPMTSE